MVKEQVSTYDLFQKATERGHIAEARLLASQTELILVQMNSAIKKGDLRNQENGKLVSYQEALKEMQEWITEAEQTPDLIQRRFLVGSPYVRLIDDPDTLGIVTGYNENKSEGYLRVKVRWIDEAHHPERDEKIKGGIEQAYKQELIEVADTASMPDDIAEREYEIEKMTLRMKTVKSEIVTLKTEERDIKGKLLPTMKARGFSFADQRLNMRVSYIKPAQGQPTFDRAKVSDALDNILLLITQNEKPLAGLSMMLKSEDDEKSGEVDLATLLFHAVDDLERAKKPGRKIAEHIKISHYLNNREG